MNHTCPACGYPKLKEEPRSKENGASFEICPSCGFQFGVSDDDEGFTYRQWRERWEKSGMKWSSATKPPKDWNPAKQVSAISSGTVRKKKT